MRPLLSLTFAAAFALSSCGSVQAPATLHPPADLSDAHVAYNAAVSSGASDTGIAAMNLVKPEDRDSEFAEKCAMSPNPDCVRNAELRQKDRLRANAECRKRQGEFEAMAKARRTDKAIPDDPGIDYPAGTEPWDVTEAFDLYDPISNQIGGCAYVETIYSATDEGLRIRRDLYVETDASPMFSCTRGWTPGGWKYLDGPCERLEEILESSEMPRVY